MQHVQIKHNTYCWKCGKIINQGNFCDEECRKEYYTEIRKENDAMYNEGVKQYEDI